MCAGLNWGVGLHTSHDVILFFFFFGEGLIWNKYYKIVSCEEFE